MSAPSIQVVKIGGSLVSRPDFVPVLRQWLARKQQSEPQSHFVLVVGGGPLDAAVDRELDGIVRKAMAPDAEARYESATAFATDLELYVAGRTVNAVQPSWPGNYART